ncbi:MAG: hypothetical protein A3I68_00020 [Candidatus Melainabacteria bacterium RIFCSPLOWO2_02_FULL_35_15]|nr:MAG: hypothetical protein A3F80_03070 [Candidatus Melainabacteria bacterium RIFCSPLOWO2_12_FULL_35_11]OGI14323.1 MAG: hypothetical protein A3I68_00020 [Candidatus Melainabacteria bacterium RIFCSPLOWO2_02_FULL_35_15]
MKQLLAILIASVLCVQFVAAQAEIKAVKKETSRQNSKALSVSQHSIELTVKDIPKGQQTLFIPIKLDTMVVDIDKVSLDGLTAANILAVASTSKDKSGTGIGLIKFDDNGLPETLKLNVSLTSIGNGVSEVSLLMVADELALPVKGLVIDNDVMINVKTGNEVEVTEKPEKSKKKMVLNQNKITLEIQRSAQKEETIFIPILFDSKIVDIDETFGHAIIAPGISAKSFSSNSLGDEGGGPGVEIVLTDVAEKDFTIDVDLLPKGLGKSKLSFALPQTTHTAIITGPTVDFFPTMVSVVNK